jgi:hypothetical protein
VDRKQTTVRSRSTYCAEKPLDLLAGTTAGKELEQRAAATQAGAMRASMELPYFYLAPNLARVHVAMEIEAGALKFENRKGKPHAELNFLGVASNSDGEVRARFSDTLKLDFDSPSQVENLKGKSLHYEKEFKIAPGNYNLTVTFGQNEASFGKLETPLVVEPWTGDLALSGLALSREARPAGDLGLAPALEGRTPLVAQGVQIVPSGSYHFSKSEPAFFYFEAYGAAAASASVRLRIVDAKTGRLPTDSLAPGFYRLEVTATGAAGKEVKRTADFTIN